MSDEIPDVIQVSADEDGDIYGYPLGKIIDPEDLGLTDYLSRVHVEREYVPKAEYDKVSDSCCLCCKNELTEFKSESVPRELVEQFIEAAEYSLVFNHSEKLLQAIQSIREQMNE